MSALDHANIQAHAQAEADAHLAADTQLAAEAQANAEVAASQVIGGTGIVGADGVYRTPVSHRLGTTTVIRPDGTTVVETAPADAVAIPGGFSPVRPLTIEEVGLINTFRAAIEEALGQTFAVWAPQAVQIQAVAGIDFRFYVGTEVGILQATITRDLNGIAELNLLFQPLGDFAEFVPGGYTPLRTPTPEEVDLLETFRLAIADTLGLTITDWEPQAIQARVTVGTLLRYIIGTNAGLIQATILTDLQGNAELSVDRPPVVAAPTIDPNTPLIAGGFSNARTLNLDELDILNFYRGAIQQGLGQILAIWQPLTVQSQSTAGVRYVFLASTNLGILQVSIFRDLDLNTILENATIKIILPQ